MLTSSEGKTLYYRAGSRQVRSTHTLTIDAATTTLTGAAVTIPAGFNQTEDRRAFTSANGLVGAYTVRKGTPTLTIMGTGTVANYQEITGTPALSPVVAMAAPASIAATSATLGGTVTTDGGAAMTLATLAAPTTTATLPMAATLTNAACVAGLSTSNLPWCPAAPSLAAART